MLTEQLSSIKYLNTREAALFLSLSPRTLEKHRTFGTGPCYMKLGGRVAYKVEELQAWAERGVRSSTTGPGHDVALPARYHDPRELEAMERERRLASRVPKRTTA